MLLMMSCCLFYGQTYFQQQVILTTAQQESYTSTTTLMTFSMSGSKLQSQVVDQLLTAQRQSMQSMEKALTLQLLTQQT
jgi:hypothetical protein